MKKTFCVLGVVCIILLLIYSLHSLLFNRESEETSYYQISDDDLIVNVIKVKPDNILLTTVKQEGNITLGGHYGINGGFFAPAYSEFPGPLCIAINDGIPVRTPELRGNSTDPYQNTGWYNAWGNEEGAGTVVYDKISGELKFICLKSGYEISGFVTDTQNYWAQGGIDFAIGKTDWLEIMRKQGLSDYLESVITYRSAMGMRDGLVYLFTTEEQCSLENFRSAIVNYLGEPSDAILLDGYLCSQMIAMKKDGEVFDCSRDYVIEEIIGIRDWNIKK